MVAKDETVTNEIAAGNAEPAENVGALKRKLKGSRRLNVILGAAAAFLLVVAIAQPLSQSNPAVNPDAATGAQTPGVSAPAAEQTPPEGPALAIQLAKADPNDPMAFGDINAPLTVIEWTDYRCPFCAKFTNDTLPMIMQEYVDKGLVRYEVRDVSFFGEESTAAAVAARAAGEQGKFAEFFDVLYAAAPESGHPDMGREKLIGFAKDAGVADLAKFEADLDRADLAAAVAASTTEAQQIGVNSVPFFVVGNTHFAGAQPAEQFTKVFAEQLELARAAAAK